MGDFDEVGGGGGETTDSTTRHTKRKKFEKEDSNKKRRKDGGETVESNETVAVNSGGSNVKDVEGLTFKVLKYYSSQSIISLI